MLLVLLLLGEQAAAAAWGGLHGSGAVTVGRHSGHGARRQRRGHEVALSDPFDDPRTRVSQWVDAAEDLGGRAMRKLLQYIPGVSLPSGNATVERGVSVVIMNWRRPKVCMRTWWMRTCMRSVFWSVGGMGWGVGREARCGA